MGNKEETAEQSPAAATPPSAATPPILPDTEEEVSSAAGEPVAAQGEIKAQGQASPATPPNAPPYEKKMRTMVLSSFGGLKGVKMVDRDVTPEPKDTQVRVCNLISGINFQDLMMRLGLMNQVVDLKTPLILGTELIGRITSVGENVVDFKEDDLVFAYLEGGGAWQEFVNIDEKLIFKITQPHVPLEVLASTYSYLVAYLLLQSAPLRDGSNVVITSAGGSVGLAFKDLAGPKGINVIGIASSPKHEKIQEGFTQLISRGQQDYVAEVKRLYPSGVDAFFDGQGGEDISRGMSLVSPTGTYILFGNANTVTGENRGIFSFAKGWWSQIEKIHPMKLFEENKTIGGLNVRTLMKNFRPKVEQALEKVWDLMANGEVNPVHDSTVHFEHVTEGMSKMHKRENVGKILVIPDILPVPVFVAQICTVKDKDGNMKVVEKIKDKDKKSAGEASTSDKKKNDGGVGESSASSAEEATNKEEAAAATSKEEAAAATNKEEAAAATNKEETAAAT